MPPETIQLGLFVLEEAIKEEPAIAAAIRDMLADGDPTADDWAALRLKVATKRYADYVPASILTPTATPALALAAAPAVPAPAVAAPAVAVFTGQITDPHA
jgi:hypothetical protein